MLSPMHPEATRFKTTTLHTRGSVFVVVWAVIHFRPYLYGTKFTFYTNHQPIKWLMTNDKLTSKLAY
jgi:hypothetical protein